MCTSTISGKQLIFLINLTASKITKKYLSVLEKLSYIYKIKRKNWTYADQTILRSDDSLRQAYKSRIAFDNVDKLTETNIIKNNVWLKTQNHELIML